MNRRDRALQQSEQKRKEAEDKLASIESTDGSFSQQLKRMDDALQEQKRRGESLLQEARKARDAAAKMRQEKEKIFDLAQVAEIEAQRCKDELAAVETDRKRIQQQLSDASRRGDVLECRMRTL